jgi:hypothetical protein
MARATVMSSDVRATRSQPRLARLIVGRNELRRPSDRIEGAVLVALSAAFLVVAVMAVFLAAHVYQAQRAFAADLRPAVAVLSGPGPVLYSQAGPVAQASWRLSNGTDRSGLLSAEIAPAIYGARTGTSVQVWLNRSGEPQLPPAGQREIVVTALIAGFIVTVGAVGLPMLSYRLCRLVLDRHRLARWGSAWAATGPLWTSRQLCSRELILSHYLPA